MKTQVEPTLYKKTKWLEFHIVDRKTKTVVIHVHNTSNQYLGVITWYCPWRQYTYQPNPAIIFNNGCLQDIADVLTSLNDAHKAGRIAE